MRRINSDANYAVNGGNVPTNKGLGNRSAIDWVLDQHKEKRLGDPTIAAKFDIYRLADYKESMIALLAKVVRVSIDTVAIIDAMRALPRSASDASPTRRSGHDE